MGTDIGFYHFVRMVEEYAGRFDDWDQSIYVQELRRIEKWEYEDVLLGLTLGFHIGTILANWSNMRSVAINTEVTMSDMLRLAYSMRKMNPVMWMPDEMNFSCYYELPG